MGEGGRFYQGLEVRRAKTPSHHVRDALRRQAAAEARQRALERARERQQARIIRGG